MTAKRAYSFKEGLAMMAAKDVGVDPYLAAEAGEDARSILAALRRAKTAKGTEKTKHIAAAQTELRKLNPKQHGKLITALQAKVLALQGRGGDTAVAHLEPGEMVVPRSVLTPQLAQLIAAEASKRGIDPKQLIVGSHKASINPATGTEEFGIFGDIANKVKGWFGRETDDNVAQTPDEYLNDPLVLKTEKERRAAIVNNEPGRIHIEQGDAKAWKPALEPLGQHMVQKYGDAVDRIAKEEGAEPDHVRTLMFTENARGHKFGGDYLMDAIGKSSSVHPMNINPTLWGGLGIDKESAHDPETNIRAASRLIKRTWDRLDEPNIAKLATAYQGLGQDSVSEYGAYAQKVYDERRWKPQQEDIAAKTGYRGR